MDLLEWLQGWCDDDRVSRMVKDDKFIGNGDPRKLAVILELFRDLVTGARSHSA